MAGLKKVKIEAWEFYQKWRAEKTYSPALKAEVRVSLMGWRHLSGATGAKKRTINDTYRRLKLLPHARDIIKTSTTVQNISKNKHRTYYVLEAMVEVEEKGVKAHRKVRVILIEDKQGSKVFYSVMDKKLREKRK